MNAIEYHLCDGNEILKPRFTHFKDSIILNYSQCHALSLFLPNLEKSWKIIYRASRDGFSSNTFHQFCDNKGPNIVIIKTSLGAIFGGND